MQINSDKKIREDKFQEDEGASGGLAKSKEKSIFLVAEISIGIVITKL